MGQRFNQMLVGCFHSGFPLRLRVAVEEADGLAGSVLSERGKLFITVIRDLVWQMGIENVIKTTAKTRSTAL